MTADGGSGRARSAKSAGGRSTSARSAGGRPRDGRIDAAIIAATRELILETGYPGLSLAAIATRAGTTTAALYRRWSGKTQLVHEAVLEAETMPVPDGAGNLGDDVRVLVETIRVMFDQPEVRMALPGLIADTVADPELHDQMIARLAGNLTAFERRFGRARSGDQLPLLVEVVAGAAIFRILVRRDAALDDDWVDQMVELIVGRRGFDADVAEGS